MFKKNAKHLQPDLFGFHSQLPAKLQKKVKVSEEYLFYQLIYSRIPKADFSCLYSEKEKKESRYRVSCPGQTVHSTPINLKNHFFTHFLERTHFLLLQCLVIFLAETLTVAFAQSTIKTTPLSQIEKNFALPPMDCWPHTRWWWPGNPVSKSEITWELEQMHSVGIRGVEQITMTPVYEKGNIPYLSDEFFEMVKHTVKEAKRLGMEVSFNFGGPGWIIGGDWVPEEDKSKDLLPTSIELTGPQEFEGKLPDRLTRTKRSWEIYRPKLSGNEKLVAVVAGKVLNDTLDENSLTVLTPGVRNKFLRWEVPAGRWRIMAFWLAKNGKANAVDHFNKNAVQRYCNYLGGKFKVAVGDEFGKTVESFFCDSFELPNLADGIYWSNGLLEEFRKLKGYDLTPYLPAIWWNVGKISPKIRYDVNEFLHQVGLEAFFKIFLSWCKTNGVKGRIQPYGFTTDNIQAAGLTHVPEMEITPGEKDSAPWFDTRIGPKKYVASGAHIYGRNVVSVEAFTFLHWERYRATLEELKIAADGFLRSGANKFYTHGYCFLPERDVAPSRRTPWAPQINPSNVWWKYYPLLTQYIARCSYLLRQGNFAPDIAIYSPLANQWMLDVLNPRKWTRGFDWGELGNLLISNGYDFDLLNDDALQNIARFENGIIKIQNMEYKILLLPDIQALPLKTMERIQQFVKKGGVVITLDRVPEYSTGFVNYPEHDSQVQKIVNEMFEEPFGRDAVGAKNYGKGIAYFIKHVIDRKIWWDQRSSILDPFLKTIRKYLAPDFGIDFAYQGIRKNEGLTFYHRKMKSADIYFVINIQNRSVDLPVTFRVKNRIAWEWNPFTGKISQRFTYQSLPYGTRLPLKLAPFQSTFFIFKQGEFQPHVVQTDFENITAISPQVITAIASQNGRFYTKMVNSNGQVSKITEVSGIPAPFRIEGNWRFRIDAKNFPGVEKNLPYLFSWTDVRKTRHFSGTARYETEFYLPANFILPQNILTLNLGKIGSIAEVILNDQNVGVVWMRGQTLNISGIVKVGTNRLTVLVTNTLINRISAFSKPLPIPQQLIPRFGTRVSKNIPAEFGFKPLPPSGLMGPVEVKFSKHVEIPLK